VLGTLTADTSGKVHGTFTVPSNTPTGQRVVTLTGTGNDSRPLTLSTPITVTAAAATPTTTTGSLPVTGARIATVVAVAAFLLLAGLGIVAGTRRRKPAVAAAPDTD
jgi:LPXTG-motif cell wall-anchored protein